MNHIHKVLHELIDRPYNFSSEHELLLDVLIFCRDHNEPTTGKLLEDFIYHEDFPFLADLASITKDSE